MDISFFSSWNAKQLLWRSIETNNTPQYCNEDIHGWNMPSISFEYSNLENSQSS